MPVERATTEEEAASLAASLLRQPSIATLSGDDLDLVARTARLWFGVAREEILRSEDWNFATGWVRPAADTGVSIGALTGRYPMPPDCLKIRFVTPGDLADDPLDADTWAVETGVITVAGVAVEAAILVTDETTPLVCYTKNVTDVKLWDAQFLAAFALALARYMGPSLGQSAADIAELRAEADDKADAAARRDAREQAPKTLSRDTSWLAARRGSRDRRWR